MAGAVIRTVPTPATTTAAVVSRPIVRPSTRMVRAIIGTPAAASAVVTGRVIGAPATASTIVTGCVIGTPAAASTIVTGCVIGTPAAASAVVAGRIIGAVAGQDNKPVASVRIDALPGNVGPHGRAIAPCSDRWRSDQTDSDGCNGGQVVELEIRHVITPKVDWLITERVEISPRMLGTASFVPTGSARQVVDK